MNATAVLIRRLYEASVFAHVPDPLLVPPARLIAYFHRASVFMYATFAVWGAVGSFVGVSPLLDPIDDLWQSVFSAAVFVVAFLATIGALFFPSLARLELFSSSSLVGMLCFYIIILLAIGKHDPAYGTVAVLMINLCVIPSTRVLFIYRAMIRHAEGR